MHVMVDGVRHFGEVPPPFKEEFTRALAHAPVKLLSFPKAGHQLHTDTPEAYFSAMRAFIPEVL